jgi:hypothetical protein
MSYIKFENRIRSVKINRIREIFANMCANFSCSRFNLPPYFPNFKYDQFLANINDCLVNGDDLVKFSAFVHASCEVHGTFSPKSFAAIITILKNLKENWQHYYLNDQIDELISLFEGSKSCIVMSYSVTESFTSYAEDRHIRKNKRKFFSKKVKKLSIWKFYHNILSLPNGYHNASKTINDFIINGTNND